MIFEQKKELYKEVGCYTSLTKKSMNFKTLPTFYYISQMWNNLLYYLSLLKIQITIGFSQLKIQSLFFISKDYMKVVYKYSFSVN